MQVRVVSVCLGAPTNWTSAEIWGWTESRFYWSIHVTSEVYKFSLTINIELDGLADCWGNPVLGNAHVPAHLTPRHLGCCWNYLTTQNALTLFFFVQMTNCQRNLFWHLALWRWITSPPTSEAEQKWKFIKLLLFTINCIIAYRLKYVV